PTPIANTESFEAKRARAGQAIIPLFRIQNFLPPDVFFDAPVFLPGFFLVTVLRGVFLAAASGAVRKSTASLVKFAASSIFDICEVSSVTNLAPLMELATKAPIPGGVDGSCRPAMTRTLFVMLRMASRKSMSRPAAQAAKQPGSGGVRTIFSTRSTF